MPYRRCRTLVPAALLVLAFTAPAAAAPANAASAEPVFLPGGVADAFGKAGFVANDQGGIDAVNLANGKLLWRTTEASQPLVVFGDLLLARALVPEQWNVLRVVVLDAARGKKLLESDRVVFPEWVYVDLAHGKTFTSQARIHKGDLLLSWRATEFNDRMPRPRLIRDAGAGPPPEVDDGNRAL